MIYSLSTMIALCILTFHSADEKYDDGDSDGDDDDPA